MRSLRWLVITGVAAWLPLIWCELAASQPMNLGVASTSVISGSYQYVVDENFVAYVASGYGVRIMDITDPANPFETTHLPTDGLAKSVAVSGDYLFVCDYFNALVVYDITDPYDPVWVDELPLIGGLRSVCPYGNYLYVAAENYGVQIVDWSVPSNLQLVDNLYTGGETFQANTFDHWLYVSMGTAGMGVYDITDPVNPQEEFLWDTWGGKSLGACLFPTQDALTLADYDNGVYILDLTYPWIPTWIATVSESSFVATHVAKLGTVGACSYQGQGIQTFNLSGNVLDYLDLGIVTLGVFDVGNYLYVAAGDSGMLVVNGEDPTNLVLENTVTGYGQVFNLCLNGNAAYLANSIDGLRTVDISDRSNPIVMANYPTNYWAKDVLKHPTQDYLYLTDFDAGVMTFDISDPLRPVWLNTAASDPDSGAHSLVYRDGYLYLTNYLKGINVYDLSNPAAPELIWISPDSVYRFREIAFTEDGQHLLAAVEDSGLFVYNVLAPDSIVFQYAMQDEFYKPFDILIKGDYAYVADYDSGLYVLDVSNAAYIFKVDSLPAQNAMSGLDLIDDTHLAVCDWAAGVAIVDISDPQDIFEVDRAETPGMALNSETDGNYLYVADTYSLVIFDLYAAGVEPTNPGTRVPDRVVLQPAYPNPFNATTSISFELAVPGEIQLSVYDLRGSKVTELMDGPCTAGTHRVNFRADDLASGLYFVRLEAGDVKQTQKVLLVK